MSDEPTPRKRRFEPWAVWPLVFFVVLIAVHMVFIVRMTRADTSSVEPDAYQRSAEYDEDLAALARFDRLGLELALEPGTDDSLTLALRGGDDLMLRDAVLAFYRPDSADLDQEVAWERPREPISLALPRSGRWRVTLTATVDGRAIRHSRAISL